MIVHWLSGVNDSRAVEGPPSMPHISLTYEFHKDCYLSRYRHHHHHHQSIKQFRSDHSQHHDHPAKVVKCGAAPPT